MPIHVRHAGAWHQFPTVPQSGRLLYLRIGGQWRPILDMWVRDGGAWHKEPEYSAILNAPTNLRMNPADANNHATIPVAWDWAGVLVPDDFQLVLTDEAGNWLQNLSISAAARSYTFTGLTVNKRYRVYISARHTGRAQTPWLGPMNWFLGQDAYVVYDVPVYGWANEFTWHPGEGQIAYVSSQAAGFPAAYGVDGNYSSQWITDYMPEGLGDQQGEGIRVHMPYWGHYLVVGLNVWVPNAATAWWSGYQSGVWGGPYAPYAGKYAPLRHTYMGAAGPGFILNFRGGNWVSDANGDGVLDVLLQTPTDAGDGPKMRVYEVEVLLQQWTLLSYDPRTVPAINSGYW